MVQINKLVKKKYQTSKKSAGRKKKNPNNGANGAFSMTPARKAANGLKKLMSGDFNIFGSRNLRKDGWWDCDKTGKEHSVAVYEMALEKNIDDLIDNSYKVYCQNRNNGIDTNYILERFFGRGFQIDGQKEIIAQDDPKVATVKATKSQWLQSVLFQGLMVEVGRQLEAREQD